MTTKKEEFYSPVARDLTNWEIRASAYDRNHRDDGTLMVDTFNTVARYRAGAYVQAWVWMPYDEVREDKKDPEFTHKTCLLYTSPSPRDGLLSRMPSSA